MPRTRRRSIREIFSLFEQPVADKFRLVHKNGDTTLKILNQPSSKKCFYPNVFISVVELSSKWILLIFLTCFLLSWLIFAFLYYIVSKAHGDLSSDSTENVCLVGVDDFLTTFQFSMETQTTIGYGTRYLTEECPLTVVLLVFQSVAGSFLLCALTGVVLFKFQQPKQRAHTVLFSKVICVYEEEGKHYIEVKILNMQRSQVISPNVMGLCVMNKEDGTGKFRFDMEFNPYQSNSRLFFRPRVYRHLVDCGSPFWDFKREDFETGSYEIIIVLNGVDEFTDSFVQVRSSYLPSEVRWGSHFKGMSAARKGSRFSLNFNDFPHTKRLLDMTDDSASETYRKISDLSYPEYHYIDHDNITDNSVSTNKVDMNIDILAADNGGYDTDTPEGNEALNGDGIVRLQVPPIPY